jgi:hypothetical protein
MASKTAANIALLLRGIELDAGRFPFGDCGVEIGLRHVELLTQCSGALTAVRLCVERRIVEGRRERVDGFFQLGNAGFGRSQTFARLSRGGPTIAIRAMWTCDLAFVNAVTGF